MALLRQTIDDKDVNLAKTLTVTDSNTEDQIKLPLVPEYVPFFEDFSSRTKVH